VGVGAEFEGLREKKKNSTSGYKEKKKESGERTVRNGGTSRRKRKSGENRSTGGGNKIWGVGGLEGGGKGKNVDLWAGKKKKKKKSQTKETTIRLGHKRKKQGKLTLS